MPAKPQIIADPLTNRGTAFTIDERKRFGLMGRLPAAVETLEQQAARAYKQVSRLDDDLDKYIYLEQLHDRNETLYYKVVIDHIAELLPVIYDPTIGEAMELVAPHVPTPLLNQIDMTLEGEFAYELLAVSDEGAIVKITRVG